MSPSKHDIRLLRLAEDDLTEIVVYIAADRPTTANKLIARFNKELLLLSDNPHLGRMPNEDSLVEIGYRYLTLDNYLIFYTIETPIIYIHRIVHGARNYTDLL
ncbi:MAG TPA: type II toxin-antitoxin system RelE/ParE family toxin [Candidatus Saccharimonadales bacterium]|jgi:toxin ParE1/3/4